MDDLINDFIAETREMLQALGGALVAWEAAPQDQERLNEIFRFVHTVKGNCGFFDLTRLQRLSHATEDVLAAVRAGRRAADATLVSAVLAIIDRIGELVEALESGDQIPTDDERLLDGLSERAPEAEAAATEAAAAAGDQKKAVRSIRLSVDLLDRMMSGVSDAVLARNELARRLRETEGDPVVEAAFDRVSACIADIRDVITRTRMQRIDSLFSMLPRMVRDLAGELDKKVVLEVDGGDVELDREMIELVRDPLTHIVRNAVDHGIEPPAQRTAAGKPASGSLRVSARQSGNQILIEVADDGRGIDAEELARKAVGAGVVSAERAERLNQAEKLALVFAPGLSTAAEVTSISGRGVGMDVVRSNVERVGGLVDVDSRPGQGLKLTIRVPLTLSIIPALTVSAAGQVYAIPRSSIEEILRASSAVIRIEGVGGSWMATIRGRRLPLVSLAILCGAEGEPDWAQQNIVLLKPAGGDVFALGVDAVHDHEELVVKPAAPAVMAAGLYAGTTLADDGRPILLLDPAGVANCAGACFPEPEVEKPQPAPVAEETSALVFRALDGSRKAVRLALVERIEDVAASCVGRTGGRMRVVVGDRILPLAGCEGFAFPEGKLRILRLSDGTAEIAYGFAEVADIRSIPALLYSASTTGEIAGVVLVDGEQVEVIDPYWLFGQAAAGAPLGEERPVCSVPGGDPWMENILRPMVESLGYRVVTAGDPGSAQADLVVAGEDDAPAGASRVLRIRSTPDLGSGNDNSIFRYDRDALLAALKLARGEAGNG